MNYKDAAINEEFIKALQSELDSIFAYMVSQIEMNTLEKANLDTYGELRPTIMSKKKWEPKKAPNPYFP